MAKEILLADSDEATQEEFKRIFEDTDYRIIFAQSGEELLRRAKRIKPDLVVAGADLSPKTGFEICEAIKSDPDLGEIPVVLLANIFENIPQRELNRFRVDGVLSRPLDDREVVDLSNRLVQARRSKKMAGVSEEDLAWKAPPAPERRGSAKALDLSLDEPGEEEEIIELVDVIEEPESRISITDLAVSDKLETPSDLTSFADWIKTEEEEKPPERMPSPEPEEKKMEARGTVPPPRAAATARPASPEETLFEKIELKDILDQVEQFRPALEEEMRAQSELKVQEEFPPKVEPAAEKALGLEDFEIPRGVREEVAAREEVFRGTVIETPKVQLKEEAEAFDFALQEEELQALPEEQAEIEEELKGLLKEELPEEEPLAELPEEEFPEALLEEVSLEEALEKEEVPLERPMGKPLDLSSEISLAMQLERPPEVPVEKPAEKPLEAAPLDGFEEFEEELEKEAFVDLEMKPLEEAVEEIPVVEEQEPPEDRPLSLEDFEAALRKTAEIKPAEAKPAEAGLWPVVPEGPREVPGEDLPGGVVESQVQEVIQKRVQEMMADFTTKIIPEMTRQIVDLTLERIERTVRELVPDLTEKAIQEEIKRLRKGEKD